MNRLADRLRGSITPVAAGKGLAPVTSEPADCGCYHVRFGPRILESYSVFGESGVAVIADPVPGNGGKLREAIRG